EERLSATDLYVRGRGDIDFRLTRTYASRVQYDGAIGQGWDFNYNERIFNFPTQSEQWAYGHYTTTGRCDVYFEAGATASGLVSFVSRENFSVLFYNLNDGTAVLREPSGFK